MLESVDPWVAVPISIVLFWLAAGLWWEQISDYLGFKQ